MPISWPQIETFLRSLGEKQEFIFFAVVVFIVIYFLKRYRSQPSQCQIGQPTNRPTFTPPTAQSAANPIQPVVTQEKKVFFAQNEVANLFPTEKIVSFLMKTFFRGFIPPGLDVTTQGRTELDNVLNNSNVKTVRLVYHRGDEKAKQLLASYSTYFQNIMHLPCEIVEEDLSNLKTGYTNEVDAAGNLVVKIKT